MRRTPECALHVHVGMPDAETAMRVFNALRERMPLLQALAANSPLWFGVDSGLASARMALIRAYPGSGHPAGVPRPRRLAGDGRRDPGRRRARRRDVPVVGPAPAPAARDGRGALAGHPVLAGHQRRDRRAGAARWPGARPSEPAGTPPPARGAGPVELPGEPRRPRRPAARRAGVCGRCASWRGRCWQTPPARELGGGGARRAGGRPRARRRRGSPARRPEKQRRPRPPAVPRRGHRGRGRLRPSVC